MQRIPTAFGGNGSESAADAHAGGKRISAHRDTESKRKRRPTERLTGGAATGPYGLSALPARIFRECGCRSTSGRLLGAIDAGAADFANHYEITVYAVKVAKLPLDNSASGAAVSSELRSNALATAKTVGRYERAK